MKNHRKDSGGYALLYVLIIILVLCSIAMLICTVALRNYQDQMRSVNQARQLYQAEGEVEKFVALASDADRLSSYTSGEKDTETAAEKESKELCSAAYETALNSYMAELDAAAGTPALSVKAMEGNVAVCEFTLTYQNEEKRIQTTISMALSYSSTVEIFERITGEGETASTTYTYKCTSKIVSAIPTYLTYDISQEVTGGGGGS